VRSNAANEHGDHSRHDIGVITALCSSGFWFLDSAQVTASFLLSRGLLFSAGSLRWVLLMLQLWAHSRNRPTATDDKKKSIF